MHVDSINRSTRRNGGGKPIFPFHLYYHSCGFSLKSCRLAGAMKTDEALKQPLKPLRIVRKEDEEGFLSVMRRDDEPPLSPMARLFHEPDCNLYVIAMIGFKTRVDPAVVKANLVHTLLKHPRFSSLQVMDEETGEMRWVPTKVDLEKHVIAPDISSDVEKSDKYVEDYVCNITKTNFDFSKPLWDLHILNIKTSDAESVGVFKIHHSLGDGTSLMSLLLACTRKTSDPKDLPSMPMIKQKPKSSVVGLEKWRKAFILVWNTIVDVLMAIATIFFLKDKETPLTAPPNSRSAGRRIMHRTISLDDVKMIKNAMNTTVNDVMVAITQAGLSLYLNRRYGEGKKSKGATEKKNNLPRNLTIRATHYMNIRPSAGLQKLAEMMEKGSEAKWGNYIGYVLLPLTIALRDNPLDYVRKAKAVLDRKKASLEAIYVHSMAELIPRLFGIKIGGVMCLRVSARTTIWYSNVPGPQEEVAFFGYPITYIAPSCFGQNNALMIHAVSYMNKMSMVLSVDEKIVPDPHQVLDDLEKSFHLIKNAAMDYTPKKFM